MISLSPPKKIPTLPYRFYFLPVLYCTVTGLASNVYLGLVHFWNYTDIGFASICAISKSINCDTVAQSSYSVLLSMPVAIWGFFVFLLLFQLLMNTRDKRNMGLWLPIFYLGLACSVVSIYFGYVSARKIHTYCIFCLLSYLCFFCITFLAFIIIRRFHVPTRMLVKSCCDFFRSRANLSVLVLLFGSLALLQWKLPHYWEFSQYPIPSAVATGRTETGAYWIGANHPKLTIEEFSDYMCFQCGKMHIFLRNLVYAHPDTIRLVHHNYPMDHLYNPLVQEPFHIGAGQMALIALYAGSKDKFWEMNDELYRTVREDRPDSLNLQTLANRIGLPVQEISQAFTDPELLHLLSDDIKKGLIHRIGSTPSYIINGKVYSGTIPLEILSKLEP
jgi:uncharacterized membrane protein